MLPTISGTSGGQNVGVGNTIDPFATTSVNDPNPWTSDTVTVTVLDNNGNASDANGKLALANGRDDTTFAQTSPGTYVLTDTTPHQASTFMAGLNADLNNLTFIASGAGTTHFGIHVLDTYNEPAADNNTSVTSGGAGGTQPIAATATPNTTPNTSIGVGDKSVTHLSGPGSDQTLNGGSLTIDTPSQYQNHVTLNGGEVDLNNLIQADSFSFKNDMLSVFGGGKTLDTLHLTSSSAFSVEKTSAGTVSIYTADDTNHMSGTLLTAQA